MFGGAAQHTRTQEVYLSSTHNRNNCEKFLVKISTQKPGPAHRYFFLFWPHHKPCKILVS